LIAGYDTTRPAVLIGDSAFVRAVLAAPHGTISLGKGVRMRGALEAYDIVLGDADDLDFEDGLGVLPQSGQPGQAGKQQLRTAAKLM
jgi:hypothetical protein